MRKTLFVTAALIGLTAAGAADARAQGSIADILSGRTSAQRYDAIPRDPIAPILRYQRELNLTRSQENRLRDIQRDLKRRNDDLEKRARRDDRSDRRDDGRYDKRNGGYDNRNGGYDDRNGRYGNREYEAAVRQMRANSERAYEQARRVLTSQQQRRLDSLYRYDDRYDNNGRYDNSNGRYDDGRYNDGRVTGRVYR